MPPKKTYPQNWRQYWRHNRNPVKWLNKPPSGNMWQRRCMLSLAVQQEGDALTRRKLKIRTLEQKKKKKDKRIKKERKIKKEEE
jgi:hypothetical protein